MDNFESAGLCGRQLAMLRFADKLTRSPSSMQAEDVAALRAKDFGDAEILAIVEVAGYYAFANRMVDGLGVLLESDSLGAGKEN